MIANLALGLIGANLAKKVYDGYQDYQLRSGEEEIDDLQPEILSGEDGRPRYRLGDVEQAVPFSARQIDAIKLQKRAQNQNEYGSLEKARLQEAGSQALRDLDRQEINQQILGLKNLQEANDLYNSRYPDGRQSVMEPQPDGRIAIYTFPKDKPDQRTLYDQGGEDELLLRLKERVLPGYGKLQSQAGEQEARAAMQRQQEQWTTEASAIEASIKAELSKGEQADPVTLGALQERLDNLAQQRLSSTAGGALTQRGIQAATLNWMPQITAAAQKYGVDPLLAAAVVDVESGGDPKAVSKAGARGLMQLMPGTAGDLGVQDSFDPEQNIDGGVRYLAQQLKRFGGDTAKALAAYNAGPGGVPKSGPLPNQGYVDKVMGRYQVNANPQVSARLAIRGQGLVDAMKKPAQTGAPGKAVNEEAWKSYFQEMQTIAKSADSEDVKNERRKEADERYRPLLSATPEAGAAPSGPSARLQRMGGLPSGDGATPTPTGNPIPPPGETGQTVTKQPKGLLDEVTTENTKDKTDRQVIREAAERAAQLDQSKREAVKVVSETEKALAYPYQLERVREAIKKLDQAAGLLTAEKRAEAKELMKRLVAVEQMIGKK